MSPAGRNLPGAARPPRPGAAASNGARTGSGGVVGRLARRHRRGWVAGGTGLVVVAVAANLYLVQASGDRVPVVRVTRDVPVGQAIGRADVTTARLALDAGVHTIPGRQIGEVVGRHAAVDLRAGTLLTASQITTQLSPRPGQALVTVPLKQGQIPPHGLAPGVPVRVVTIPGGQDESTAPGQDTTSGQPPPPGGKPGGREVAATVDSVGGPDADGSVTVALLVADADSALVACTAAAGHVALVITARGG